MNQYGGDEQRHDVSRPAFAVGDQSQHDLQSDVQYPPLLPPVGVWAVSQSQCGRSPSQAGYGSSLW